MTRYEVCNTKQLRSTLRKLGYDFSDIDMTQAFHDGIKIEFCGDTVVLPAGDGVCGSLRKHGALLGKYGDEDGAVVEKRGYFSSIYRGKHRSHTKGNGGLPRNVR